MHHENEKMALFEALYREYLVPLKKYAYRIGVGYDDIEDMVHEAFIEYYKRYSLDLDHKVKLVLLIRILRSKWIDNRRQMRRREMLHLEDPDAEEEIMNLLLEGEIGIQLLEFFESECGNHLDCLPGDGSNECRSDEPDGTGIYHGGGKLSSA